MSVSNEVLLDVQGLEKAYGGNQVLNGITTQIRRGEVVAWGKHITKSKDS